MYPADPGTMTISAGKHGMGSLKALQPSVSSITELCGIPAPHSPGLRHCSHLHMSSDPHHAWACVTRVLGGLMLLDAELRD